MQEKYTTSNSHPLRNDGNGESSSDGAKIGCIWEQQVHKKTNTLINLWTYCLLYLLSLTVGERRKTGVLSHFYKAYPCPEVGRRKETSFLASQQGLRENYKSWFAQMWATNLWETLLDFLPGKSIIKYLSIPYFPANCFELWISF